MNKLMEDILRKISVVDRVEISLHEKKLRLVRLFVMAYKKWREHNA